MFVSDESLQQVETHWAVASIQPEDRERARSVANARLVKSAMRSKIHLEVEETADDRELLERVAFAYELAAFEGIDSLLNANKEQAELREITQAAAWRAFELYRVIEIPENTLDKIFHFLRVVSLAYSGDRGSDLIRWIHDNEAILRIESQDSSSWDMRILTRIFDCWLSIVRKRNWEDLERVVQVVESLRGDQAQFEAKFLSDEQNNHHRAHRLIALYNWAKATEILAKYVSQGVPLNIRSQLDRHFQQALDAAESAQDMTLEVILKWLSTASLKMVDNSLWAVAAKVSSEFQQFVQQLTTSSSPLFELLPPQRIALQSGLLDQASTAIVVDLPTSGGKTLLAEFRILQALNQFASSDGWVAYVAPTRALVSQLTRRLRQHLSGFEFKIEQLSGAVELDTFEEELLASKTKAFDVLVCTPEKLQFVIRNGKLNHRPLALCILDEAHNIEDKHRGLRIELLLATIQRECSVAKFLLLMPFVPNAEDLASWLGGENNKSISLGTSAWRPNERIVGLYHADEDKSVRAGWQLKYTTLLTPAKNTLKLQGIQKVNGVRPLNKPYSEVKNNRTVQTAAMAKVFSERGTSIAVAKDPNVAWSMAQLLVKNMPRLEAIPDEIALVQRFLETEIGKDFKLIEFLNHGIAVHHAGLSDEARGLIEWLAESNCLRVLCATTTIAQGINFPVSSVFLSQIDRFNKDTRQSEMMGNREFWNLAGRAGRFGQDSVGIVGVASGSSSKKIADFISQATTDLVSRLQQLLSEIAESGELHNLQQSIKEDQWRDYRCFVAHMMKDVANIDSVIATTDEILRGTFGYSGLRNSTKREDVEKADALLKVTKEYVASASEHKVNVALADSTGFAPEGVRAAFIGMDKLRHKLKESDWEPSRLFGDLSKSVLPELIGVMKHVGELKPGIEGMGGERLSNSQLAEVTSDWVNGATIRDIALRYFSKEDGDITTSVTEACKAIYRNLATTGPWGLSALTKIPTSGLEYETISEEKKRQINLLPAMIYHGVRTESAVLLRMNSVPRSVAEPLGELFAERSVARDGNNVASAREFLRSLPDKTWNSVRPKNSAMSGADYRYVWETLSGIARNPGLQEQE